MRFGLEVGMYGKRLPGMWSPDVLDIWTNSLDLFHLENFITAFISG